MGWFLGRLVRLDGDAIFLWVFFRETRAQQAQEWRLRRYVFRNKLDYDCPTMSLMEARHRKVSVKVK